MPEILRFRSTWGFEPGPDFQTFKAWFPELKAQGYAGVEITLVRLQELRRNLPQLKRICDDVGLKINVLTFSAWPSYDGPRPTDQGVKEHLQAYREQLIEAQQLDPFKINCQSGADYFTLEQSVEFYKGTLAVDAELGLTGKVCHETHRNRSLFNPYSTFHVVTHVPEIRLTADISHHVLCCERLLDENDEDRALYAKIIPHFHHIHARIGTTQSSQCPEPEDDTFTPERTYFEKLWQKSIETHVQVHGAATPITFVPEYGPYPYHAYNAVRTFSDVADSEGKRLQTLFEGFAKAASA